MRVGDEIIVINGFIRLAERRSRFIPGIIGLLAYKCCRTGIDPPAYRVVEPEKIPILTTKRRKLTSITQGEIMKHLLNALPLLPLFLTFSLGAQTPSIPDTPA